jgi:ABC-type dipeptide/oligopeptide/nickel transport system permease subunit
MHLLRSHEWLRLLYLFKYQHTLQVWLLNYFCLSLHSLVIEKDLLSYIGLGRHTDVSLGNLLIYIIRNQSLLEAENHILH